MKRKQPTSLPILHKGQLWKTKTARVEIMHIGKLLAHYRYFVDGRTRVSTTMARVRMIQDYLNANGGKLIKNDRLKVSVLTIPMPEVRPARAKRGRPLRQGVNF